MRLGRWEEKSKVSSANWRTDKPLREISLPTGPRDPLSTVLFIILAKT